MEINTLTYKLMEAIKATSTSHVAKELNVSRGTLTRILQRQSKRLNINTLVNLALYFDVDIDTINEWYNE